MAARKRLRRKQRRKAPVRRHAQSPGPAPAARGQAESGLKVGGMMDPAEKAADHMATRALAGLAPGVSPPLSAPMAAVRRQCAECAKKEQDKSTLKRASAQGTVVAAGAMAAPAGTTAARAVKQMGSGRQMSPGERSYFEPRFGRDFGAVRIHEGAAAATAARSLGARAFAIRSDIAFAPGQRDTATMAHELAHVVQDSATTRRAPLLRRLGNCTSKMPEPDIITAHSVENDEIFEPKDKATAKVTFGCRPKSFRSDILDSSDARMKTKVVQGSAVPTSGEYTFDWNGKRGFDKVGTFMADDGKYRHRLADVVYAYTSSGNKMINGGGEASASPEIDVSTRQNVNKRRPTAAEAAKSGNRLMTRENHLVDTSGADRQDNIELLAKAMRSEAGIGNDAEREAVGWSIRNGMVRINSYEVSDADAAIPFATDQAPTAADLTVARDLLGRPMSDDKAGGAVKWYSPRSMPPNNKNASCKSKPGRTKMDCNGGEVKITDASNPAGSNDYSYAPAFHNNMTFVPVTGTKQWRFRFYKL